MTNGAEFHSAGDVTTWPPFESFWRLRKNNLNLSKLQCGMIKIR